MRFWIWRSEENKYFELVFFRVVHKNLRNYFFSMVKLKQTGSIYKFTKFTNTMATKKKVSKSHSRRLKVKSVKGKSKSKSSKGKSKRRR